MLKSILRFFGLGKSSNECSTENSRRTLKSEFIENQVFVQEALIPKAVNETPVILEEAPVKVKRVKSTEEKPKRNPRKPKTPTMSDVVETPKKPRKPKVNQTEAPASKPKRTRKTNSSTDQNS